MMTNAFSHFVQTITSFVCLTFLLFLAISAKNKVFSSDIDLVSNACWNNGYNRQLVQAARLDFELTVSNASITEETIQSEIEKHKEDIRQLAEQDSSWKPHLEKIFENIPAGVRNRFAAERKMKGKAMFNCGNSLGGVVQARHKIAYLDPTSKKWSEPNVFIGGTVSGKQENAQWESSIKQTHVLNVGASIASFQAFGRLDGPFLGEALVVLTKGKALPASIAELDRDTFVSKFGPAIRVTGQERYDEGKAEASVVEYAPKGTLSCRLWIDPSRGYVCPKIQVFDMDTKKMIQEWQSKNYFLHQQSSLWYPALHEQSTFDKETGSLREKKSYSINQQTFALNKPIALDEFTLEIPEYSKVVDYRNGQNIEYTADAAGTLSLVPGGMDLANMDWLRKVGDLPKQTRPGGYGRVVCFVLGFALLFWGLRNLWRQRKENESK